MRRGRRRGKIRSLRNPCCLCPFHLVPTLSLPLFISLTLNLSFSRVLRLDGEDGDQPSTELSSAWGTDGAVREPPRDRRPPAAGGVPKARRGFEAEYGGRSGSPGNRHRGHDEEGASGTREGMGVQAGVARRRVHTGWLGDFGPAHTHTVREMADDGQDYGESADGDGSEGGSGGGGDGGVGGAAMRQRAVAVALGQFGFERDRAHKGKNEEEEEGGGEEEKEQGRQAGTEMYTEEKEESEGGDEEGRRRRRSPHVENSGQASMSRRTGDDDHLDGSDGLEAGVGKAVGVAAGAARETAETTDSVERFTDIVSPRASHLEGAHRVRNDNLGGNNNNDNSPVRSVGGSGGGDDGGGRNTNGSLGVEADDSVVGPFDGGLDAYLQLADSSALLDSREVEIGGGGDGAGGGGSGVEGGVRVGGGIDSGASAGGYTGATTGSWWEEDSSALETEEAGVGGDRGEIGAYR